MQKQISSQANTMDAQVEKLYLKIKMQIFI